MQEKQGEKRKKKLQCRGIYSKLYVKVRCVH